MKALLGRLSPPPLLVRFFERHFRNHVVRNALLEVLGEPRRLLDFPRVPVRERPLRYLVRRGGGREEQHARERARQQQQQLLPGFAARPHNARRGGGGAAAGADEEERTSKMFQCGLPLLSRLPPSPALVLLPPFPRIFSRPQSRLPVYVEGALAAGAVRRKTHPAELSRRQAGFPAGGPLRFSEKRGRARRRRTTTFFRGKEIRAARRALRARTARERAQPEGETHLWWGSAIVVKFAKCWERTRLKSNSILLPFEQVSCNALPFFMSLFFFFLSLSLSRRSRSSFPPCSPARRLIFRSPRT